MGQSTLYLELKQLESKIDTLVNPCNTSLMTRKQVMEMLSIGSATLDRWSKQGVLKRYGLGGRVYFKKNEIIQSLVEIEGSRYD